MRVGQSRLGTPGAERRLDLRHVALRLRLGRDVDVVSKQSSELLHLFRRELLVVNENFRLAGSELARAVLGWIGGKEPGSLQSLSKPSEVLSYRG